MLTETFNMDSFRIECKFPKSIMMNLFIPAFSKFDHMWHIKYNDEPLKVIDESYDGEHMYLYYHTESGERFNIENDDVIHLDIEIWNARGARRFMGKVNLNADEIIYVCETWKVSKQSNGYINTFELVETDDVIITELLKPRWDMNMFQKKIKMETEPDIIDVDFVEVNENQIEMKEDK